MSELEPVVVSDGNLRRGRDPEGEPANLNELRCALLTQDFFDLIHHFSCAFSPVAVLASCIDDGQFCGVCGHARTLSTPVFAALAPVRGWAA